MTIPADTTGHRRFIDNKGAPAGWKIDVSERDENAMEDALHHSW